MPEGTIKRLTDKGFGFIDTGSDKDMFFHSSNLDGVSYEELQKDNECHTPKDVDRKGQEPKTSSRSDGASEEPSFSITEKPIWLTREKKIKAKGNNRKRPSLPQKKNEN